MPTSLTLFSRRWRSSSETATSSSGRKQRGEIRKEKKKIQFILITPPFFHLNNQSFSQMDQIRGGRGGGWKQVEQTSRSDLIPALALRASKLAFERHGYAGHGGQWIGTNNRSRARQYGQQKRPVDRRQRQSSYDVTIIFTAWGGGVARVTPS